MGVNLEKIARMALFDVSQKQIAYAVGVSEGRITQIMTSSDYQKVYADLSSEYFENNQTLNEAWDKTEAIALDNLLVMLEWNKDPDLMLKIAAMANRANRRGQTANTPLNGMDGVRAVIHLNQTFIERLQQVSITRASRDDEIPQKDINVMTPGDVERSFISKKDDLLPPLPDDALVAAQ